MVQLPEPGTSAQEFLEEWFPHAFAEAEIPEETRRVEVTLGIRLEGEGGGEWLLHLERGEVQVEPGATEQAAFTLIQSVEDWRGCLWEGRGGIFGRQAALLFQPTAAAEAVRNAGAGPGVALSPVILQQLQGLQGVIRLVVAEGSDSGDWRMDFKLGSGSAPKEPTTTVTLPADAAAAMERGELDPLQAFLSGRLQVAGDIAFLMQMQAVQLQGS